MLAGNGRNARKVGGIEKTRYNKVMDETFDDNLRPRKRMKLKSWLILIFLPVALLLPSFGEFVRIGIVGREVVCCDPADRSELEAQAVRARENRQLADIIMRASLIGSMALAGLVLLVFLVKVVRFLPGLLKLIFGLAILVASAYVIYTAYRMWDYYTQNTDEYYRLDAWSGFLQPEWYLPTEWERP